MPKVYEIDITFLKEFENDMKEINEKFEILYEVNG